MVSRSGADLEDGHLKLGQRELALKVAQAVLAHGGAPPTREVVRHPNTADALSLDPPRWRVAFRPAVSLKRGEHNACEILSLMLDVLRRTPRVVVAYALLYCTTFTVGLARSTSLWNHHPARGAVVAMLVAFLLAAVVVRRQPWAWVVLLLLDLVAVLSPAWGEWNGAFPYVNNVVSLALIMSPPMRRWVGIGKPRGRSAATQMSRY
jgi:hypothetical protein